VSRICFFSFRNSVWECLPRRSASNSYAGSANVFRYRSQTGFGKAIAIGSLIQFIRIYRLFDAERRGRHSQTEFRNEKRRGQRVGDVLYANGKCYKLMVRGTHPTLAKFYWFYTFILWSNYNGICQFVMPSLLLFVPTHPKDT